MEKPKVDYTKIVRDKLMGLLGRPWAAVVCSIVSKLDHPSSWHIYEAEGGELFIHYSDEMPDIEVASQRDGSVLQGMLTVAWLALNDDTHDEDTVFN